MLHPSDTLLGAIVGGIIGFGSSIGVNHIEAYITRPILSIIEQTTEWEFTIAADSEAGTPQRQFTATRIRVENQGRTAAEDCKASLVIPKSHKYEEFVGIGRNVRQQHRVAWMIPKDDFTVTINADDAEYIDLCAYGPHPDGLMKVYATTERGYGSQLENAAWIEPAALPLAGQLKVSASNAKKYVEDIWISTVKDSRGKFVYFPRSERPPSG